MSQWLGVVLFVVVILVVVLIHEGGHFLTAKAFGIKVQEFFVGFGPRLWSFRRGETEYGVKAFPLGGYVRIAGMNPLEENPPEDEPRLFNAKPIWQRALVILAGPITHFFMALLFLTIFFAAIGVPQYQPIVAGIDRTLNGKPSPAAVAGLRAGDELLAVNGHPIRSPDDLIAFTHSHVGQPLTLTISRDGHRLTITATPVLSKVGTQEVGRLGVLLGAGRVIARDRVNPLVAVGRSGTQIWEIAKAVVTRLGQVFGPAGIKRIGQLVAGTQQRNANDVVSVVGGARLAGEAAQAGAWDVLFELFAIFNVFVGILNLVPLPPLDGGHLAVLVVEKIRGKKVDARKLLPITAVVAGFMILFVVSLVYLDIVSPIPNPFH
jgi:membrane-associated protease RseP (regulator of RpoE activity)